MVELKIDNSECSLTGLSVVQLKALREILSYESSPQLQYHTGIRPTKSYLISQKGVFPTGLLYLVKGWIKDNRLAFDIKDLRIVPKRQEGLFTMNLGYIPYPEQLEASRACLAHSRGIVSMVTGSGKSLVAALIINQLQVPTLVVVPSLELKTQLTKSLKEIFGSLDHITVMNVDSVPLNKPANIGCVILDEFHHSGAKTYRKLNKVAWKNVYYKFGLTATPFRSQDNERLLLESVLSQVIYKLNYRTAVNKGYIVPVEAFFLEVLKTKIKGNEKSWPAMYSELVVNNEARNDIINKMLKTLHSNKISTLCLVKEIKHGEILAKGFPFMHGESETNRMDLLSFLLKESPVLIGTTGVLGEGIDTKPAEWIIIAGLGKSKNSIMQQIGRGVRRFEGKTSCKVLIFFDKSHKWTRSHFREQCSILLNEYGIVPMRLDIS